MAIKIQLEDSAPWKQRYRAIQVLASLNARNNPQRGLLFLNAKDSYQWYRWDLESREINMISEIPQEVFLCFLSPDGEYIYFLEDQKGNEIGHYVRIPYEGGEKEDITPKMSPYSSFSLSFNSSGSVLAFVTANQEGFQVYSTTILDQKLQSLKLIKKSKNFIIEVTLSSDGEIIVIETNERSGKPEYNLLAFNTSTGKQINELWDGKGTSVTFQRFSPLKGDYRVLGTCNKFGNERPFIWNTKTGDRRDFRLKNIKGDVRPLDWSPNGNLILLYSIYQAVQQLYVYNLDTDILQKLQHPSGVFISFSLPYFISDEKIVITYQNFTQPCHVIELDSIKGKKTGVLFDAGEGPKSHLLKSISFSSSDGSSIQGWLGLPSGQGPFPTILDTHGGPEAVISEVYSPDFQMWLDHGFAVLTVNYRGSTTFGKEFQSKIWGNPGYWEVEDMESARNYLVENNIASSNQIFLTGWSYGGYLTLQALGLKPDLWIGGMAGIAIADWTIQYEDASPMLKGYLEAFFSGKPEEKPDQYRKSSPITYVENVKAPVLVIQGRNDTRTPARPVEMYEKKMKELGKDIEVIWYETGHVGSMLDVELSIKHQEYMLKFAYRVLNKTKQEIV
ncbi:MAG: prolyl oligopeptidase family serine peptidase [Promethearchaeota archaeon]